MTSAAWLFSKHYIERFVVAPNKYIWVKMYKVLAVLDKTSRAEVLCVLRGAKWRMHAHLSSGLFEPLVPRSTLEVPPIATLSTPLDDHALRWTPAHNDALSWMSVDRLEVSAPFRWPGDRHFEESDPPEEDDGRFWHESFVDADTQTFVIVVQILAQFPRLVPVDAITGLTGLEGGLRYVSGQPVDVTGLPVVFRAAGGLAARDVASADYPAGEEFSYRRFVKALPTSTVREIWNAVANVEGWDTRWEGMFAWHFPRLAHGATVRQYFDSITPPQETAEQEEELGGVSEANMDWFRDGRSTLLCSWSGCDFRFLHSELHPHFNRVTVV